MNKVTIDRSKWLRGYADPLGAFCPSVLWSNGKNAGCCLGHAIHQITHRPLIELNFCGPSPVFPGESFLTSSDGHPNQFADEAMKTNDSRDLSDHEREQQLINLFRRNNIELVFT